MINLFQALRAELMKLKGTGLFWLATAGTAVTNIMIAVLAWYLPGMTDQIGSDITRDPDAWVRFHYDGILPMLLPMFIVILCALSVLLENRANSWKVLYALPLAKPVIYTSKLLAVLITFILSHLLFWMLMCLIPYMAGFGAAPGFTFYLFQLMTITLISSAGILGLMFFISYFSRGLVLPLAVGIVGFVMAQLLENNGLETVYFPFSQSGLAVNHLLGNQIIRYDVLFASVLYFALILAAGIFQSARDFGKT